MPPIIAKLLPGRTEEQKARLTEEITKDVTGILHCGDDAVSAAFEEISSPDWARKVYQPDILSRPENLDKKPGYTM